jgi:hypothetical protein
MSEQRDDTGELKGATNDPRICERKSTNVLSTTRLRERQEAPSKRLERVVFRHRRLGR